MAAGGSGRAVRRKRGGWCKHGRKEEAGILPTCIWVINDVGISCTGPQPNYRTPVLDMFEEPDCWDCHVGFPITTRGSKSLQPRWLFSGCNENDFFLLYSQQTPRWGGESWPARSVEKDAINPLYYSHSYGIQLHYIMVMTPQGQLHSLLIFLRR
jgi:hypothetical protein